MRWFNLPAGLLPSGGGLGGEQRLSMKDLRGKHVVLVDFWTYSCVNCIRTLPHIRSWHDKYAKFGLVIVGVHTPEFEFEKNVENVARAIKEFGIEYPVVMDSDYQIWSLYSNNSWPHKFLINKDGQAVYEHAGEGAYAETEEAIRKALSEINPGEKLPSVVKATEGEGGVCYPTTPETYLGTMRGRAGKTWNFSGDWKVYPEYIEYERKTEEFVDYLSLNFEAMEINLVMGADGERAAKVRVELDGKLLKELEVSETKMYNLANAKDFGGGPLAAPPRGELIIFAKDRGLRAYAFTFGGCI